MLDQKQFSINMQSRSNGVEWTQYFPLQIEAELYMWNLAPDRNYRVLEYNFTPRFSMTEMEAFLKLQKQVSTNAHRLEKWARQRTQLNYENPELYPCEVCGKAHGNFNCCEACNYGYHRCHFCGDDLGHKTQFSSCYITLAWEENYAQL